MPLFRPLTRALAQLDDRAFVRVLLQSLALSGLAFAALLALALWAAHALVMAAWLHWAAGAASFVIAAGLTWLLYTPLAVAIASCFIDQVAEAVDRRYYPHLTPPKGASLWVQIWDGLALGGKVLALNLLGLALALLLPGVGFVLGWAVAAWALGRGLFVAVAMRRMSRTDARSLYRRERPLVLAQGAVLALAAATPPFNLLVPVIGAAAMVHVLESSRWR